ncbi:unnamed protein product, partial [Owenia fusiformis]
DIAYCGIRGGTFEWTPKSRSRFQKKTLVACLCEQMTLVNPQVVYLQLGDNDLNNYNVDIQKIFTAIKSIAQFIVEGYDNIRIVCIGHVFKRLLPKVGFDDFEKMQNCPTCKVFMEKFWYIRITAL